MRTSSKKTPAAVLRSIIGIKDFEMAELLQCSPSTIHSIESGRLPVSKTMATKMFHQTGVSPEWVLAGNPKKRPTTVEGKAYTKAAFERAQKVKTIFEIPSKMVFSTTFLTFASRLRAILVRAAKQNDFYIPALRTGRFLASLGSRYGDDQSPKNTIVPITAIKEDIRLFQKLLRWTAKRSNGKFEPINAYARGRCDFCGFKVR